MKLIPVLQTTKLFVLQGCGGASEAISTLIAEASLRAPVHVLDGGNRFAAYRVMRLIRRRTVNIKRAADHIILQRAFTCYQMLGLLEGTAAGKTPCILLDLLTTFHDETIPTHEARRVLQNCLAHLERLSLSSPVVLTLMPPGNTERAFFADLLMECADIHVKLEEPAPGITQPALF